ncbi:dihydroorotase [Clostridium folliculivorans]|uniref:Dihydroorotase n=1 Tax=Clostridium folliculivorans TaxID=2886038 RepID=A0A9W5Y294_9CLOT|nr:dihydroorotase [Clostridium folliculivorans]GKU25416.1 dihydroorotase [Clostridium folliculivorans]GKU28438.1 dihydroorotase [Clostridium folliculivorans]
MDLLIKNANIIDASHSFYGDIYIRNGKIEEISSNISDKKCEIIDAEGLTVMPAFVDMHAHFREPGFIYKEDLYTGSRTAAKGGYTTVNLMANTNPICSSKEVLDYVYKKNEEADLIDVHQCVSITKNFDGQTITHLEEFSDEVKAISDDGKGVSDSRVMMEAMNKAKEMDWLVISHAESHEFSDIDMRLAENMMTWRDVSLAKYTGARLHMAHVSTKEAMKYVIDAKCDGTKVTCEVTPHHIALSNDVSNYRVNPPIRPMEDVNFLVKAIEHGDVDVIGTDHAPHSYEDKEKGAPGLIGLETAFPICYTKLVKEKYINLNKLSEMMSSKPAELLKLKKGKICPGYEGDLVIIDLEKNFKVKEDDILSKSKNTPFLGWEFYGVIEKTIKAGKIIFDRQEEAINE